MMNLRSPVSVGLAAACLAGALAACTVTSKPSMPAPPPAAASAPVPPKLKAGRTDAALAKRLVAADTRFGFRLFHRLSAEYPGENVFYSPYSVASALAMTWNGASGDTKDAMAKTLGLAGMPLAEVDRAHAQLATRLRKPGNAVQTRIANSLWGGADIAFEPDFLRDNRDYFGAEIATVDYHHPQEAADRINAWVRTQTQGTLDEIVQPASFSDLTALLLVNALYFQGTWLHQFDPKATKPGPFTLANGTTTEVPLMHRSSQEDYRYLHGKDFQAVRLPYGTDPFGPGRFAMYIFLPDRAHELGDWLKTLTPERWSGWLKAMEVRGGTVVLPKFRVEFAAELSRSLTDMRMGIAFDRERADFGRMLDQHAYIKRVDHKALLDTDEKGTVAAAATSVQMELLAAHGYPHPFKMVVDHPFFCAIRDDETGEVLFMGAVWRPGES